MDKLNQHLKKWWDQFSTLAKIQTKDPTLERKGKMLALYITLLFGLGGYLLINDLLVLFIYKNPEYKLYVIQGFAVFIPLYFFWSLNRKGQVILAAYLSLSFSILATALGTDAKFMEYLMVVFSLPIGIASFVISPPSSFLFAFLTGAAYVVSSIATGYIWEYNLIAIITLFCLALITWAAAQQLENALQKNDNLVNIFRKSNRDIKNAYETTLEGWSHAMEIRDHETEGHTRRVTDLTDRIAIQMGFKEDQIIHIHRGALLHDIGKLGIPDEILRKPDKLNEDEMKIMQTHTQIACDLLRPIEYLRPALNIPCHHHEKWDGTGYPLGLKGKEIPLEARIFAIVDVYDALSYDRPYRKAWTKEKVLAYIQSEAGRHFDPEVVGAFVEEVAKDEN